ncbi:hypothetical protein F4806DRAFT_490492 [Annulohypoxylon nitens]|nr:hypothetical protein F4806DRAFT_490492 [Annulohypoxylon nitens]
MFANLITVVVSALAASAAAADAVAPRETYGTWQGKSFVEECVEPTQCHAKFTVSGAKGYFKDAPAFTANCHPAMNEAAPIACDSPDVKASFSGPDKLKITVTHSWNGANKARFTATGTADISSNAKTFDIPVAKIDGVA